MHFFGYKKYVLLPALAVLLLFSGQVFAAWVTGVDVPMIHWILVGGGAFLFVGLLVWASTEEDGDKEWIAANEAYRANRKLEQGGNRWNALEEVLTSGQPSDESTEDSAHRTFQLVDEVELEEREGVEISYFTRFAANAIGMAAFISIKSALDCWFSPSFITFGFFMFFVMVFAWGLYCLRQQNGAPQFPRLNFQRLDKDAAYYRNAHFYAHHQMLLLDAGWKEAGDFRRATTYATIRCTLFVNPSSDMVAEVGVVGGSLYYAIRTATSDGVIRETSSLRSGKVTDSYIIKEAARMTFDKAVVKHAHWIAEAVDKQHALVRWTPENCLKFMSSRLYVRAFHEVYES